MQRAKKKERKKKGTRHFGVCGRYIAVDQQGIVARKEQKGPSLSSPGRRNSGESMHKKKTRKGSRAPESKKLHKSQGFRECRTPPKSAAINNGQVKELKKEEGFASGMKTDLLGGG